MSTIWANDSTHFWGTAECDGLFLLFDTSARSSDGVSDVDSDDVIEHVRECLTCSDSDVHISVLTDGTEVLEGGGVW